MGFEAGEVKGPQSSTNALGKNTIGTDMVGRVRSAATPGTEARGADAKTSEFGVERDAAFAKPPEEDFTFGHQSGGPKPVPISGGGEKGEVEGSARAERVNSLAPANRFSKGDGKIKDTRGNGKGKEVKDALAIPGIAKQKMVNGKAKKRERVKRSGEAVQRSGTNPISTKDIRRAVRAREPRGMEVGKAPPRSKHFVTHRKFAGGKGKVGIVAGGQGRDPRVIGLTNKIKGKSSASDLPPSFEVN